MPRFPNREPEVFELAGQLVSGFRSNLALFPAMPVSWHTLAANKNAFRTKRDDSIAANAAAEQAVADKDAALANLTELMKTDLRYAENTVDFDDAKLKLLGWSAKAAPTELKAPGQTLSLEVPTQGEASLTLSWQAPIDGGKVSAYRVVRRIEEGADEDVATAVKPEASLTDQPLRTKLAFKVIAINKAGQGPESNTIEVVL